MSSFFKIFILAELASINNSDNTYESSSKKETANNTVMGIGCVFCFVATFFTSFYSDMSNGLNIAIVYFLYTLIPGIIMINRLNADCSVPEELKEGSSNSFRFLSLSAELIKKRARAMDLDNSYFQDFFSGRDTSILEFVHNMHEKGYAFVIDDTDQFVDEEPKTEYIKSGTDWDLIVGYLIIFIVFILIVAFITSVIKDLGTVLAWMIALLWLPIFFGWKTNCNKKDLSCSTLPIEGMYEEDDTISYYYNKAFLSVRLVKISDKSNEISKYDDDDFNAIIYEINSSDSKTYWNIEDND